MESESTLIKVFTGTEVVVHMLKGQLEEIGVGCLIRNDYAAGAKTGFYGGTTSSIYLLIQKSDLPKAQEIIDEFIKNNPDYVS